MLEAANWASTLHDAVDRCQIVEELIDEETLMRVFPSQPELRSRRLVFPSVRFARRRVLHGSDPGDGEWSRANREH